MTVDLGSYGDPAAPTPPARAPRRQLRRPLRRPSWRAVTVLVAAVLVAAADVAVASARHDVVDPGPAATAQRFYDAVRDRDAATALAQLDLPAHTDRRLLTAAALAQPTGLTQPDLTVEAHHGDSATVEVTYAVTEPAGDFGQPVFAAMQLELRRSLGGLLHDTPRWRIVAGLPTVTVLTGGGLTEVTVAGAQVSVAAGPVVLPSFPGLVPVSSAATPLLAPATVDLVGGGASDPQAQTLLPGPSGEADSVAAAAVEAAFQQRTDRLVAVQQVQAVDEGGFSAVAGGIELHGQIDQTNAAGITRAWETTVTVRLVGGLLVAGDVVIRYSPEDSS